MSNKDQLHAASSKRRLAEALARMIMNQPAQLPTAINAAVVRNSGFPKRLRGVPQPRPDSKSYPYTSLLSPHRLTDMLVPLVPPSPETMEGIFARPTTPPPPPPPETIEDILALHRTLPSNKFGKLPYYPPRFIHPMWPDEYDNPVPDEKNTPQDDLDPFGMYRRQWEQPFLKRIENAPPLPQPVLNALLNKRRIDDKV
jgi:hypothetical protein